MVLFLFLARFLKNKREKHYHICSFHIFGMQLSSANGTALFSLHYEPIYDILAVLVFTKKVFQCEMDGYIE